MKALARAVVSVTLLAASATAQDKDDLKSLRAANSLPFYRGVVTGMTSAYVASYFVLCPRPMNRAMVLAVVDSSDHPYDDYKPAVAVLKALEANNTGSNPEAGYASITSYPILPFETLALIPTGR